MEGEKFNSIVDTEAESSVLLKPEGPLSGKLKRVQGLLELNPIHGLTTQRAIDLGMERVTHSFLVIAECPCPLLG